MTCKSLEASLGVLWDHPSDTKGVQRNLQHILPCRYILLFIHLWCCKDIFLQSEKIFLETWIKKKKTLVSQNILLFNPINFACYCIQIHLIIAGLILQRILLIISCDYVKSIYSWFIRESFIIIYNFFHMCYSALQFKKYKVYSNIE